MLGIDCIVLHLSLYWNINLCIVLCLLQHCAIDTLHHDAEGAQFDASV